MIEYGLTSFEPGPRRLPGREGSPLMLSSVWPCGSHVILAVTGELFLKASMSPSRTLEGPPMRESRGVCKRPGIRSAAETNMMRSEG